MTAPARSWDIDDALERGLSPTDYLIGHMLGRTTHLQGPPTQIVVIEAGMTSGRSAVVMRLGMPDGSEVVVEWSLAAFVAAARAAEAFAGTWGES